METPIEIHNNNSIELTKIIKIGVNDYYFPKKYFYLADIFSIEASRYGVDKEKCTIIIFNDGNKSKFKEPYKQIRDTYKAYQKYLQEVENKEPPATE